MTRRDEFKTVLDADLLALRERHAWRLRAERERIARERQRAQDAAIVAEREARVAASRVVARAREAVR